MRTGRDGLLASIVDDVARNGLGDRSLRDLAAAVGTSHRMVLYHFSSRDGLAAAIVGEVEARERAVVVDIAATVGSPADLIRALWRQLTSPEVLPFVSLFFEVVALTSNGDRPVDFTAPYLSDAGPIAEVFGGAIGPDEARLVIATVRGLLVDVLTTGETEPATRSLEALLALMT